MLRRKFELIPIKMGFFMNFKNLPQKPYACYCVACQLMDLMLLAHLAYFVGNCAMKQKVFMIIE